MKIRYSGISLRSIAIVTAAIALMTVGFWMLSQSSPAVVKAQTGLGGPLPNLTPLETTMFNSGSTIFARRWDSVHGLGPVFTQVSCSLCHLSPVIGGASLTKNTFFGKINPDGSFNPLTEEGGMFLQPFSIQRFTPGCILKGEVVPVDATVHAKHLTPEVFGMGLIDSIPDQSIRDYAAVDKGLGIVGIVDEVTDEKGNARVGKYGYKAQFATVMQITASAMVHDIGITSPLEPIEDKPQGLDPPPQCVVASEPNDPQGANLLATFHFVMYLAPNPPGTPNANGQTQFDNVGCSKCHLPTYTTGPDIIMPVDTQGRIIHSKALSSQPVNLYSDLLLHEMGSALGDGLPLTPSATATMFRTTPLWGLSTRIANGFGLLHDGRTANLDKSLQVDKAIRLHGGEAAQSITLYKGLLPQDQADLIAFISSL